MPEPTTPPLTTAPPVTTDSVFCIVQAIDRSVYFGNGGSDAVYRSGDLAIDFERRRVTMADVPVSLTPTIRVPAMAAKSPSPTPPPSPAQPARRERNALSVPAQQLLGPARRDRVHGVGGPGFEDRHRLLLGWVGLRTGRWGLAQAAVDRAARDRSAVDPAGAGSDGRSDRAAPAAPRDLLLAAAIEAGLARRAGDLAALSTAWGKAEPVLVRHPADLFSLDVIGELAISASRLGLWDRVAEKARELGDVVRGLGSPPLWLLPLRWVGLQVALAGDDREAAARRAAEVQAVAPAHSRLAAVGAAAEAWVGVLANQVDVAAVQAAAADLAALGLTWEASRLVGQAAIRAGDPTITRSLLEQARDLKAVLPAGDANDVPLAASVLSEREQTVAQYVVDGLTHKEIGAQLYISPKTVEHHVAKIRQKLGASTRAEMMAALKTQLGV